MPICQLINGKNNQMVARHGKVYQEIAIHYILQIYRSQKTDTSIDVSLLIKKETNCSLILLL